MAWHMLTIFGSGGSLGCSVFWDLLLSFGEVRISVIDRFCVNRDWQSKQRILSLQEHTHNLTFPLSIYPRTIRPLNSGVQDYVQEQSHCYPEIRCVSGQARYGSNESDYNNSLSSIDTRGSNKGNLASSRQ